MLFYAPGDGNWWLGECPENFLSWSLAGNTQGKSPGQPDFGNIADGRPFWIGDFTGAGKSEVLFYAPGDGNWWLAQYDAGHGHFAWSLAGNTQGKSPGQPDFGNIADGRPFWIGDFTGAGKSEVLFYAPGDGNWWLAQYDAGHGHFAWSLAGNTQGKSPGQPDFGNIADGRPFWIGDFTGPEIRGTVLRPGRR